MDTQWRQLCTSLLSHFYKQLETGEGGTVSRRTANDKLSKLYRPPRKHSTKRPMFLQSEKSGKARPKTFPALCAWQVPSTFKFVPVPLWTVDTYCERREQDYKQMSGAELPAGSIQGQSHSCQWAKPPEAENFKAFGCQTKAANSPKKQIFASFSVLCKWAIQAGSSKCDRPPEPFPRKNYSSDLHQSLEQRIRLLWQKWNGLSITVHPVATPLNAILYQLKMLYVYCQRCIFCQQCTRTAAILYHNSRLFTMWMTDCTVNGSFS